jgi:pimeloyl-ACP methyl ester carboxylesterase
MAINSFLNLNGANLYYEVAGETNKPTLVFIHAGVADRRMWDEQVEFFAPNYRVIRYDARGFGNTKNEDIVFSERQDVIDLLDHLAIEKAVLIGCSRGGRIAIDTTLEFPNRVNALVAVCSALSGFDFQLDPNDPQFAFAVDLNRQADIAQQMQNWKRLAELDTQFWGDGLGQPLGRCKAQVREKIFSMCLNRYELGLQVGKPIELTPPAANRLYEIDKPTLVITGELDTRACEAMGAAVAKGIRGAMHVVFQNCAHVPNMEQPDIFNQTLSMFLKSSRM